MASTLWKLCGFGLANTSALDVRGVRLWASAVRVETAAALTASDVPASGELANLLDGDVSTGCVWDGHSVINPGFFLGITFTSAVELTALELDIGESSLSDVTLCQFKDGVWEVALAGWFGEAEPVVLGSPSAFESAVLADGPTTYLPCTESSGDVRDAVGTTAGFSVSSTAVRGQRKLMQGAAALEMPGRNANYPLLNAKNTSVGNLSGDFTLEFVMRGQLIAGFNAANIFSKEMGGQSWPEYRLRYESGSLNLLVRYGNDNMQRAVDQTSITQILDSRRHHIAFTRQATRYRLYVDGVAVMDASSGQTPLTGLGTLSICGDCIIAGYASSAFSGAVSGVALYNRALTGAQIAAHIAAMGAEVVRRVRVVKADELTLKGVPSPDQLGMKRNDCAVAADLEFGGRGRFYGTVSDDKTRAMLQRRVRLHRSRDGMLVRETWSKADGSYAITGINERYEYDIEAWDHEKNYFTTVANNQLPEVV